LLTCCSVLSELSQLLVPDSFGSLYPQQTQMVHWTLTTRWLLLNFFQLSFFFFFLYFSPAEDSPGSLPRIPFGKARALAFCIQKLGNLPGVVLSLFGVDLVLAEPFMVRAACCWEER